MKNKGQKFTYVEKLPRELRPTEHEICQTILPYGEKCQHKAKYEVSVFCSSGMPDFERKVCASIMVCERHLPQTDRYVLELAQEHRKKKAVIC